MPLKPLFFVILAAIGLVLGCSDSMESAQNNHDSSSTVHDSQLVDRTVEASCGQCQFGMEGNGCDLAIRIDGEAYYVDGSSIDDHGDAHAEDGLCNCIREAVVTGEIKNGRFLAESIQLKAANQTPDPIEQ